MKRKVHPDTLQKLRQAGGRWAAYENQALDSHDAGRLQFLKYGNGCTHSFAPAHAPDSDAGLGWKYHHIGYVELVSGLILDKEPEPVN
jgi:hypothetical protein